MIHISATLSPNISELAEKVAADGIAAHHDAVVMTVHATGLAVRFPILTDVVVDGTAPPVARERAIGQLAALAGTPEHAPVASATTSPRRARAA